MQENKKERFSLFRGLQDWSGCVRTKAFMKSMHKLKLTRVLLHLSCSAGDLRLWYECDGPCGLLLCPSCGKASHSAKMCPQATIDRISWSVCACACACTCPCTCLCLRACTGICVQCMCQGQLFLLFLSRASGKSPSSLSKRSFLRGTAIDCHRSPPLINPSQRQSTQSETSTAQNLFNLGAGSSGLVWWNCWI